MKNFAVNFLLIIISVLIFVAVFEVVMKFAKPYTAFGAGTELAWMRKGSEISEKSLFTIDPDIGFRPNVGNDKYNEYGTRINEYNIEKDPNKKRLLFIGDSVTARAKIVDALKQEYGEDKYEYWNAGVESFNTIQEVKFYQKYNQKIKPDHVILTFHNNDFSATPIAFVNKDKKLVVYTPYAPLRKLNPWLYKNSTIYRLYFRVSTYWQSKVNEDIVSEVKDYLEQLRDLLKKDDISFSVILLPMLYDFTSWNDVEIKSRESSIKIFQDLDIKYYDLLDVMNGALAEGVNINETKGDSWHPSEEVAEIFAKYLKKQQILTSDEEQKIDEESKIDEELENNN